MLIAILMTNTDETDFAKAHPGDGEKFSTLIGELRPDWRFEVFSVKDNVFPDHVNRFDGVLITGSPASVHDSAPWIARLEALIREMHQSETPMYGACFGHQVIATSLGGKVDYNPGGWVLGSVETCIEDGEKTGNIRLYAAHKEQVAIMPPGATIAASTPGCPIAGFKMGKHVLTTQYHPEMTPEFIAALVDEMEKSMDRDIIDPARESLIYPADRPRIANIIVRFFEEAVTAQHKSHAPAQLSG